MACRKAAITRPTTTTTNDNTLSTILRHLSQPLLARPPPPPKKPYNLHTNTTPVRRSPLRTVCTPAEARAHDAEIAIQRANAHFWRTTATRSKKLLIVLIPFLTAFLQHGLVGVAFLGSAFFAAAMYLFLMRGVNVVTVVDELDSEKIAAIVNAWVGENGRKTTGKEGLKSKRWWKNRSRC